MIKKIISFLVILLVVVGLYKFLSIPPKTAITPQTDNTVNSSNADIYKDNPIYDNPDLIFYWGNGCPHCKNVEDWLDKNNADKKIKVNYKEIYYNDQNRTELINTAKQYCSEIVTNDGIGVPVGFDPVNKKCIQGDTPIIDFLKLKIK